MTLSLVNIVKEPDLLAQIFFRLNPKDFHSALLTCKEWNNVLQDFIRNKEESGVNPTNWRIANKDLERAFRAKYWLEFCLMDSESQRNCRMHPGYSAFGRHPTFWPCHFDTSGEIHRDKIRSIVSVKHVLLSEYGNCATVPTGLDFYIGGSGLDIDEDSDSDSDVIDDDDKIEYKSRTGAQIDIPRGDRELEIVRMIRKSHYDDDTRTLWLIVQSRTDSSKALLVSAYLGKVKERQGFKIHAYFDAEDVGSESTLTEKFVCIGGHERKLVHFNFDSDDEAAQRPPVPLTSLPSHELKVDTERFLAAGNGNDTELFSYPSETQGTDLLVNWINQGMIGNYGCYASRPVDDWTW